MKTLRLTCPKPPPVREEDLQQTIVQGLRLLKYRVLVTSRRRKRFQCSRCGAWGWPEGGDGVDKGLPDVLCYVPERQAWIGLEVKGTRTAVSPEQRELAEAGCIHIVRTWKEALEAVKAKP